MLHHALAVVAVISALYALAIAVAVVRLVRGIPLLARLAPPDPQRWPRVSVIIPACNEASTIEQALRSRLAEGYPDAEYIVVDDRSTDATGDIIDRLARDDARVLPIHVRELPAGWLGKIHAMHVATARATGEWILFSDADIHHQPGTLRRVVAHCEDKGIDHVAVFPDVWSSGFWIDVLMNTMMRVFSVMSRAWKVGDPASRASVGGGNFTLVRRTALDHAGGLEPLKLEIIDDAALGQALKWSGARQAVLNACGFVGLSFYGSVREAVLGVEKNAFAAMGRFNALRALAAMAAFLIGELGAPMAMLGGHGWVRAVAAAAFVALIVAQLQVGRWLGRPALPSLLAPLGAIIVLVAAMRSMVLTLRRGGVQWRGTLYPLDALRRGMRYVLV
jgi:hypothetical protein